MKTWQNFLVFAVMCTVSSYCVAGLYRYHLDNKERKISIFTGIPEPAAKALTLEFSGLVSDYMMLNTLTFMGERIMNKEEFTPDEWEMVYQTLIQITNLDPRFLDPYIVAQMSLPWDAGMVTETNILLEKAAKILTDDYRPTFFLWYNYFYFLNNPKKAGYYLEKSAKIPGAPQYFSTLAARMNLYAGRIYAAVIFLQQQLNETSDPSIQKFLKVRLEAMKKIGFLEQKIKMYREKFNSAPKHLQDLIDKGLLTRIPRDPYGGKFYIMADGRVYTTSELVHKKTQVNTQSPSPLKK